MLNYYVLLFGRVAEACKNPPATQLEREGGASAPVNAREAPAGDVRVMR